MLVDRLAWVVYALIWTVAVGYWVVPSGPRALGSDAPVLESSPQQAIVPVESAEPPQVALAVAMPAAFVAPAAPPSPTVSASAPELLERLKPVLNRGTNLAAASADFEDATEFAAVAHAARNTRIPFMVLKHRVVQEKMSLADAIRASFPQVNAEVEADLAVAEARSDLAALAR